MVGDSTQRPDQFAASDCRPSNAGNRAGAGAGIGRAVALDTYAIRHARYRRASLQLHPRTFCADGYFLRGAMRSLNSARASVFSAVAYRGGLHGQRLRAYLSGGISSMKIVHFAKFYPPEFGGIETVTQALAEDHAAAGHEVEVVCFTVGVPHFEQAGKLKLRRVKVQKVIASQPLAVSYLRACNVAARDADVVHVHAPNMLAAIAVMLLPRHVSVIIHWHADIENKGTIGLLVRPIERAMLRRANVVVTTTQEYAKASPALTAFQDRVKVIPIGIADIANVPKFEISTPPYVLFVGRLVPYKGLDVLLDAIAMVKSSAVFRIVGVGPQLKELKLQTVRLGIAHRVEFMGRVDEFQLQSLIEGAAIFCLPSINRLEAFGVVLLEAMRAGRAVISTNIPGSGVPTVNSSGINIPVKDPRALANAIDRLINNPKEIEKLGRIARINFKNKFSRRLMSDRFLCLYKRIIENKIFILDNTNAR